MIQCCEKNTLLWCQNLEMQLSPNYWKKIMVQSSEMQLRDCVLSKVILLSKAHWISIDLTRKALTKGDDQATDSESELLVSKARIFGKKKKLISLMRKKLAWLFVKVPKLLSYFLSISQRKLTFTCYGLFWKFTSPTQFHYIITNLPASLNLIMTLHYHNLETSILSIIVSFKKNVYYFYEPPIWL